MLSIGTANHARDVLADDGDFATGPASAGYFLPRSVYRYITGAVNSSG